MATITCECPNCNGTGKVPHYSHIANGDCFACGATGRLNLNQHPKGGKPMISLVVWMRGGEFDYADHRCTLLNGNNWGRCLFAKNIDDADQARAIWRSLKGLPNASLQTANVVSTDVRDDEVVNHQDWQTA